MVNGGEELLEITAQYIAVTPGKLSAAIQRGMGAFAFAIGIRIGNKAALVTIQPPANLTGTFRGAVYL
jgi:hypothetical protein